MKRRMNGLVTLATMVLVLAFSTFAGAVEPIRVLFDDTHGQTAGNADWTIQGAYSEMIDILKDNGFSVDSLKKTEPSGKITPVLLSKYQALILAEPNNPYSPAEQTAMVDFVRNGGGAFFIADHGGADRDNDGYDAVKAINEFSPKLGFEFAGDFFYEAPVSGGINKDHPVTFGVRAVGAWAGSTIKSVPAEDSRFAELIISRRKKAPYLAAVETGKGRVVAIGDSSPFDDGTGSGGNKKLHDSFDSFMYSHPQLAFNALKWVTGQSVDKRIPSRTVAFAPQAKPEEKDRNLLIDAAHGNPAADKMETFERHMNKLGIKVYYSMTTLTPEMLKKFSVMILPNPSLSLMESENPAICEWLMSGGRLLVTGDWDSADLQGRPTINNLLKSLGSVIRLNDDQVWDHTNKTNKPWGVLAHVLKPGHPVTEGIKTVITWGTCSLIDRNNQPLTEKAGVEILISGDNDSFNKDGNKKNDAILYPKGMPIPLMAVESLANGMLAVLGCSNFTDYQYPDSDLNASMPGPAPFTHETPRFHDNLIKYLLATGTPLPRTGARQPRR